MSKGHQPAIGGSSLLVIFAVLCLTVFALLALATVKADMRMADESTKAVKNYYKADSEAEEILAKIREGETPAMVTNSGDYYAYSTKVSGTQVLSVVVKVQGQDYRVYRWKVMQSQKWSPKEYMKVWTPKDEE
ncbi:MAG: hypothetical protein K6A30_04585 [Lachnospiraceae bacterium]|nr:hypothetical protein [Lachnospiraceae bacterium]